VSIISKLFADFAAQGDSEIWNIQLSEQVTAPIIRQTIKRDHGNIWEQCVRKRTYCAHVQFCRSLPS